MPKRQGNNPDDRVLWMILGACAQALASGVVELTIWMASGGRLG
jgi:hypothetical protein